MVVYFRKKVLRICYISSEKKQKINLLQVRSWDVEIRGR